MKRIVSLFLCMALAVGAVTYKPPKADAIALELSAALIGKVVGVSLISMGMAWAVDQISINATGNHFGENVAREIQDWLDEEHNCEVIDVFFGGMMPNASPDPSPTGNVVLTASVAFVSAVAAFGKWLYDKYALSENESAVVFSSPCYVTLADGSIFYICEFLSGDTSYVSGSISPILLGDVVSFSTGYVIKRVSFNASYDIVSLYLNDSEVSSDLVQSAYPFTFGYQTGNNLYRPVTYNSSNNMVIYPLPSFSGVSRWADVLGIISPASSLSVSAPDGLNLPDTDSLPEGQGYALELPETNGAPVQDLNDLMDLVVPIALTDPAYVPTLSPTELPEVDPTPTPSDEEVPEPAPAGATIIDYLVDIWRKIKALPETIGNGLKSAFEPDPELVTEITTTFTDKFGWLETIHRFGNDLFGMTAETEPPVIYIHLEDAEGKYTYGGTEKALDLSWYQRYKADVDHILSGFMWLAFLWLVFKRASSIIQGGEMITEYTHDIDQGHK